MQSAGVRKEDNMIIDRFEGDYAVIEISNNVFENIAKTLLPDDAKEGDEVVIITNKNRTREKENNDRLGKLFID